MLDMKPLFEQASEVFHQFGAIEAIVLTTFGLDPQYLETHILPAFFPHLGEGPTTEPHRPLFEYLEDAPLPISVFYDANQLIQGDHRATSVAKMTKSLRWQAHSIAKRSGCFHPKVILALVNDKQEGKPQKLVMGCGSANLTKSGWGLNLEGYVFHAVDLTPINRNILLLDILGFLDTLLASSDKSVAVKRIREAIGRLAHEPSKHRKYNDNYRVRFWHSAMGSSLADWLIQHVTPFTEWRQWGAEVLSPYYSNDPPMLLRAFNENASCKGQVLCYCPLEGDAVALLPQVIENYRSMTNVVWAKLRGKSLSSKLKNADGDRCQRFLHAKVYRLWNQTTELLVVGSANATTYGHADNVESGQFNDEACLIFSRSAPRGIKLEAWLKTLSSQPQPEYCKPKLVNEDEPLTDRAPRVTAQYDWQSEAFELQNHDDVEIQATIDASRDLIYALKPKQALCLSNNSEIRSSLFRSPSILVRDLKQEASHVVLVEELMLHAKPPAPSFDRGIDDLIRDWQMSSDERIASVLGRNSSQADSIVNTLTTESSTHTLGIEDRLYDLFLAVHSLKSQIKSLLNTDKPLSALTKEQIRIRLFGRGIMSVRYFLAELSNLLSDESDHLSASCGDPVNGGRKDESVHVYLAALSLKECMVELEKPLILLDCQRELRALNNEINELAQRSRVSLFTQLQAQGERQPEKLLTWIEANWNFYFMNQQRASS